MAAYPTLRTTTQSTMIEIDGQVTNVTEANTVRITNYADAVRYEASLVHILNATDMATLLTFYDTNRNAQFTYTWPAEGTGAPWVTTYTMRFVSAPRWRRIVSNAADASAMYSVQVRMASTAVS